MHALSSSVNIYSFENQMNDPIVIHTVGHPNSVCWRDDETIIVTEQKQLSQFSINASIELLLEQTMLLAYALLQLQIVLLHVPKQIAVSLE